MAKPKKATTARASSDRKAETRSDDAAAILARYAKKRDFAVTPEPPPRASAGEAKDNDELPIARGAFVVQRHDARRLHYDVRLEIDGAMMSFAVPKGPSYDPAIKRFAIETEDHPMEYNAFEGSIPKGEYGGGEVILWDRGEYETKPPGQAAEQRRLGQLKVRFFGEKLRGEWHFVRTGERVGEGASWLLFKARDRFADATKDVVTDRPESVATNVSGPRSLLAKIGDVARATNPRGGVLPSGDRYTFEIKYDGYRLLAVKSHGEVRLYSRAARDWTERFQLVADAIALLPEPELVIDGEACAVDENNRPSFQRLQQWIGGERGEAQLVYAAFDVLFRGGEDVRPLPIEKRRELLAKLLEGAPSPITISSAIEGDALELMRAARAGGLEGLVAKRKGSPYAGGPTSDWIKMKCERRADFAVVGYQPLSGFKNVAGSLVLAVMKDGVLTLAGKVGTGLDDRLRRWWAERLDEHRVETCPAVKGPEEKGTWRSKGYGDALWSKPTMVVEVGYIELSDSGRPRHPTYLGLREDKTIAECVLDDAAVEEEEPSPHAPMARAPASPEPIRQWPKPTLSNRDKVLFPRDGITKRHVWDYYTAIAPVMLPHLRGRPINVQRWPNGIDAPSWFQHRPPEKSPAFVRLIQVSAKDSSGTFASPIDLPSVGRRRHVEDKVRILVENVESLQWLANLAALTLHQWASHEPAFEQPDYFVIDLDPGAGTWADLIQVTTAVRTLLDALELVSVLKTSGKRGLHVVVPLGPGHTHPQATGFAEQIARAVAKVLPKIASVERIVEKRGGKLYVDFGQNGAGRTVVSPYSVRAIDGATVSTPLRWDELSEALDPRAFTIRTVLDRVEKHGDLFEKALCGTNDLHALAR
jgi:bifunctional non-homologous end joining protein LigD